MRVKGGFGTNLMFAYATAKDNHTSLFRVHAHTIQTTDIANDINDKLCFGPIGMTKNHVAKGTVCKGRAKDWNIILRDFSANSKMY